jgi:hypothetical protein
MHGVDALPDFCSPNQKAAQAEGRSTLIEVGRSGDRRRL